MTVQIVSFFLRSYIEALPMGFVVYLETGDDTEYQNSAAVVGVVGQSNRQ